MKLILNSTCFFSTIVLYNTYWQSVLMRDKLIKALLTHAQGDIQKHLANVEVYLSNPAGIGEHSDITEAIETELNIIAKYKDQIDVINKYLLNKWWMTVKNGES